MYEFSLTRSVNNAVLSLCEKSGWSRVRHIVLKIGGLRKVNLELMAFIFSVISKGTQTEGANFSIMELPVIFRCRSCGRDAPGEITEEESRRTLEFACPLCGSRDVELLSGLELAIELLEVEKEQE
ncbi:MAG: hydrogenase maturation nickel metallochaperone HypA [Fretibacterium sp.]|nr:hydrogenase maturation nickel metallochaperone HypA [Fretibacterium sp.]